MGIEAGRRAVDMPSRTTRGRAGAAPVSYQPAHHAPVRPDWNCRTCAEPWPCVIRRRQLWSRYLGRRAELVDYLRRWLAVARTDRPEPTDVQLDRRFLGWIR